MRGNAGTRGHRTRAAVVATAAVAAALAWLALAPSSHSATGDLTFSECFDDPGTVNGCTDQDQLGAPRAVAAAADGRSVYVVTSGDDTLVNFDRNTTTGKLTFSECFSLGGAFPCTGNAALDGAQDVAVSSDGTSVIVAGASAGAVVSFKRGTWQGCSTTRSSTSTATRAAI